MGWTASVTAELLSESPKAIERLRSHFDVPLAKPETLASYIFTFGSTNAWWSCVGVPHLNLLRTHRCTSEKKSVQQLLESLAAGAPITP